MSALCRKRRPNKVAAASKEEAPPAGEAVMPAPFRRVYRLLQRPWNRFDRLPYLHRRFAVHWQKADTVSLAAPLIAFSIFLLSRPYQGIVQDAYIYIGRALADLDPNGIGNDLMYVHDGQSGFSLFRYGAKGLAAMLGPATAARALAFAALTAWFLAAAALARQFASGGAVWAIMIFAALLPAAYGAPYPFSFAEPLAIPRPFAEAFVLAALAALGSGHAVLSLWCLIAGALIHPLMVSPGIAVFFIVLGIERKALFFSYACALGVLLAGAAMGLPVLDRLFAAADPSLRSLYESRSPYLFPSQWPADSFPPLIVQAATIALAAHFAKGRLRRILAAIIAAGLGGIAVSAVFGDWLSSLLITQLQPWRMTWLMSAAGAISLGVCALKLWPEGAAGRIVLALLVLSWSFIAQFPAALAGILALYLYLCQNRYANLLESRLLPVVWIFALCVSAIWQIRLFVSAWQYFAAAPAHYGYPLLIFVKCLLTLPLCLLAASLAIAKPRAALALQTRAAVSLFPAAMLLWDQRTPDQRFLETGHAPKEIMRLIDGHKGEVLWIGGFAEAWFLLGRPQWATPVQGISIIFSSALASEWRSRTQILVNLKLASRASFTPRSDPQPTDAPQLSRDAVERLCARSDAPAWIIAPIEHGPEPPAGLRMTLWQLPVPRFKPAKADGGYVWQQIGAYAVIPCAGQAQTQPLEERG